ncbi:uncharacterized protein FA14DRAFT_155668 [Meira miltonrushii]|uniref:Uncharacterized protein n=1 Tax=Meira miltonrushii TaxID=1280837 RepID=A0A316VFA4_9BASI|nr:uncharacterized protein FA14DRAFT_155668 [Meira miltonrushii]PWN36262.1 hypothetical protein FA14DRAFT_155668 [Meira miltonrushii]
MKQTTTLATAFISILFHSRVTSQLPLNSHESQSVDSDWKAYINWPSSPAKASEPDEVNSAPSTSTNVQSNVHAEESLKKNFKYSKEKRKLDHLKMREDPERWQLELMRKRQSYHLRKIYRSQEFKRLSKAEQRVTIQARKEMFRKTHCKGFRTDAIGNIRVQRKQLKAIGSREASPDWFRELESQNFDWGNIVDLPSSPERGVSFHNSNEEPHPSIQSNHPNSETPKDDRNTHGHGNNSEKSNTIISRERRQKQENSRRYYDKLRSDPKRLALARARDKSRHLKRKVEAQERLNSLPQAEREAEIASQKSKRSEYNKRYHEKHSDLIRAKRKIANKPIKVYKLSETEREIGKRKMQLSRARKREREKQQKQPLSPQQQLPAQKNPWSHNRNPPSHLKGDGNWL